jgi:hypothetical protein
MRLLSSLSTLRFIGSAFLAITTCLSSTSFAANITVDCSGATPGAFTSLQAAINSLDVTGPHTITVAPGPCTENVSIMNRQRITIASSGAGATFDGSGRDVFSIAGSTSISLSLISAVNGNRGFVITRASEVILRGASSSANINAGIRVDTNSTLAFQGSSSNNGGLGMNVLDSAATIQNSHLDNNGLSGIQVSRSRVIIDGSQGANTFDGNGIAGVLGLNGAWINITAPTTMRNNTSDGLDIEDGASARLIAGVGANPATNLIDGNGLFGVNLASGTLVIFAPAKISNNGGTADPFNAGIRVDDNAVLIGIGPALEISGNHGPGIDQTNGGSVDLTAPTISNNTGDGLRLTGNTNVFFEQSVSTITGNGGRAIHCDDTSVVTGDRTGLPDFDCRFSPFPPNGSQGRHKGMRSSQHDND